MGRRNRRRKSSYSRKMKGNPQRLITRKVEQVHNSRDEAIKPQTESSELMPRRGDVWFAELGEHPGTSVQEGCRPAFIMSNDMANTHSEIITVVPMTSKMKRSYLPTHVALAISDVQMVPADGLPMETSMVLAEQITTIGKSALKTFVGRISENKTHEIEQAVDVHLGLD